MRSIYLWVVISATDLSTRCERQKTTTPDRKRSMATVEKLPPLLRSSESISHSTHSLPLRGYTVGFTYTAPPELRMRSLHGHIHHHNGPLCKMGCFVKRSLSRKKHKKMCITLCPFGGELMPLKEISLPVNLFIEVLSVAKSLIPGTDLIMFTQFQVIWNYENILALHF